MAVTFMGDVLYFLALMKTSPLVVTVGSSLTLPLAAIGDFILHKSTTVLTMVGCVVVLVSFGALGVDASKQKLDVLSDTQLAESDERLEEEYMEMTGGLETSE